MNIAFTICSNNYLAQAKTLGDSLLEKNPDYKMIIGLCDKLLENIDYDFFTGVEIISVLELDIDGFEDIIEKYDIVELNTSIKPVFFKHLINKYQPLESLIYFDPDIQIFSKLELLETYLRSDDILLTPHILSPINVDDFSPSENLFLNYGIYNLGFLALNPNSENVTAFLDWWEERTLKIGFSRVSEGLFVDQLWINFVPIFFKKVKILKEYGLNTAPWNLHERNVIFEKDGELIMEDESKLVFYHFSNYNYQNPELLTKYYNRYNQSALSEIIPTLYSQYHFKLISNKVDLFSKVKCHFIKEDVEIEKKKRKNTFKLFVKDFVPPIFFKIFK